MSPQDVAAKVAAIKTVFNGCFGCGMHNSIGLHLDAFEVDGDTVRCAWVPRPDYRSFPDVIHGGIVTAALDEVMAWTAMLLIDHAVVTGTMDLRFRRPAPRNGEFVVSGRLDDHRGKRVMLSGWMEDGEANVIASAKGMFITTDRLDTVHSAQ